MQRFIRQRKTFTWLALVALFALALLPSVSQALAFARGADSLAQVCTAQGARWVQVGLAVLDQNASDDAALASDRHALLVDHTQHCPLCALQASAAAPLPVGVQMLRLPLPRAAPVVVVQPAPRRLFVVCTAQPRGPPLSS